MTANGRNGRTAKISKTLWATARGSAAGDGHRQPLGRDVPLWCRSEKRPAPTDLLFRAKAPVPGGVRERETAVPLWLKNMDERQRDNEPRSQWTIPTKDRSPSRLNRQRRQSFASQACGTEIDPLYSAAKATVRRNRVGTGLTVPPGWPSAQARRRSGFSFLRLGGSELPARLVFVT